MTDKGQCVKRAFNSERQALANIAPSNSATGYVPCDAYQCKKCKKWHLTSKPRTKNQGGRNAT